VVNQPIAFFTGHCAKIFTIDVSGDGNFLASAAQDFDMKTWRIDADRLAAVSSSDAPVYERPANMLEAHASAVSAVAFSRSSDTGSCYLASGGTDHRLAIWKIDQKKGSGSETWSMPGVRTRAGALVVSA
jgi:WD40 repeat protein